MTHIILRSSLPSTFGTSSSHKTGALSPLNKRSPFPPPTAPGSPPSAFCVYDSASDASYRQNSTVFVFLWLASFTSYVLEENFPPVWGWIAFRCVYMSHLVHPFIWWGTLGCFHNLPTVNNAAVNMGAHIPLQDSAFSSPGCISRTVMAGSCGNSIFNFFQEPPYYFPQWSDHLTSLPIVHKGSNVSISPPSLFFFLEFFCLLVLLFCLA